MNDDEIKQELGDMGMKVFVRYYPHFKAVCMRELSHRYLCLIMLNHDEYTPDSCNTRISAALRILRANAVEQACVIIENAGVEEWVQNAAREIRESL